MASETNSSSYKHPEGSTPILTINIPGGLAINVLGIISEICPICISIIPTYHDQSEDKVTNDSPKSLKSLKSLKFPKHSKHLKPLKPPKPLKHPKSPKPKNYPTVNTSNKCTRHKKR